MKKTITLLLIMVFIKTGFAQYEEMIDVSDALQSTLDVRTAAVRIVKDYLYRGLKVNYVTKENDNNLSKGETSLLKLEIYGKEHPELSKEINTVKKQWKKLRHLAINMPKKEKMKGLLKDLNDFLTATDNLIEGIKNTDKIEIINYQHASNEMEILAQQLAFLFGLKVAGINDQNISKEIERCQKDFQRNLDLTFFSGENTIEITEALKLIQADWEMGKQTNKSANKDRFLNTIYILMNKISNNARKASLLYQEKAKNELKKR
jgi:hypothetical protein